jgi:hypothetical protein
MTTANLDATDLKDVDFQGLINEDVMQSIFDISPIPLPFTNLVGSGSIGNAYSSWTIDQLGDPALGGWQIDGADAGANNTALGSRIGNHSGILDRVVKVSTRARASDTIGMSDALAYQVEMRQKELRRNVEANALGNQASVEADADNAIAGVPAGFPVQCTKYDNGSGGTGGVFSAGLWTGWTAGAHTAVTETSIRDMLQAAWEDGGDPVKLMSVPSLIRAISEYMFTSSSRIATLTGETNNNGPATAMGSVNTFLTDFGVTVDFVPNRIQQVYKAVDTTTDVAALIALDPSYAEISFLSGYAVEALAKTGLSDVRQMSVDYTVKALEPNAHRVQFDCDPAQAVTY